MSTSTSTSTSTIKQVYSPQTNTPPRPITVVIVHYGDDSLVERCLDSVRASAGVSAWTVVVDNCGRSNEELRLRVHEGQGNYLHFPENPGFAAGANAGLRCALLRDEGETLVLLNSDIRLGRHCLRALAECLEADDRAGVVGPALLTAAQPRYCWNVGSTVSWPQGKPSSLRHGARYQPGPREPKDVDYVCGAALAFKRRVLRRVGFLDEEYYLYFEDAEFSFRVRESGYRVLALPAARAWHCGGAAFEGLTARALYYRTRNRLLFSARWNPCPLRGRCSRASFALRALLRAARHIMTGRRAEGGALSRAVMDYYCGVRGKHFPTRFWQRAREPLSS